MSKIRNILMTVGATGSGKSFFVSRAERFFADRVSLKTAQVRRDLGLAEFGKPTEHRNFIRGSISRASVYEEIAVRVDQAASEAVPWILLDGAYESQEFRGAIYSVAERHAYDVFCLYFHCPRPLAIRRIEARADAREPTAEARDVRILNHIEDSLIPPFADREITSALSTVIDLNSALMTAAHDSSLAVPMASDFARLLHASGYVLGRMRPRIGLDFDGVIANTYKAKRDYAAAHYGIDLREPEANRENGIRLLGEYAYMAMIHHIYSSDLTSELEEMPGSVRTIQDLDALVDCYVVTARNLDEVGRMRKWVDDHGLMVHGLTGTSEGSKRHAIESLGLSFMVDDSKRNLLDLGGCRAILFDPFDASETSPAMLRITSWEGIYSFVQQHSRA